MSYFIGLDIGGTKTAICLANYDNQKADFLTRLEVKTTKNPKATLEPLFNEAKKWMKQHEVLCVGVSCGGPLDSKKGIIICPPSLPGWEDFDICSYVKQSLGLDAYLQNDANACAVAEHMFGAGKKVHNMVFLTFGTGLGSGLIIDDRLYEGTNGNAGEIGHVRLANKGPVGYNKEGSVEGFASGGGISRLAKIKALKLKELPECVVRMGGVDNITTKQLAEFAHQGDKFARSVFRQAGKMFGRALSILIDIINPELIVVGGVYMRSKDLLIRSMKNELRKEALAPSLAVCKIVPATLGEQIGDYGALAVAIMNYENR